MIMFPKEFFRKMAFTHNQIKKYLDAAYKNLQIAKTVNIPEVMFKFSYDALIQLGITVISFKGYKVRSRMGHHIKILEITGKILKDSDIEAIGNMMRSRRNTDLYGGGSLVSEKQSKEYVEFVETVYKRVRKYVKL